MRFSIFFISIWALVSAKPEMYREKEDFQYSRSSTDEGSKSGYYGAQRGNMGGNYEKAHNMDNLAQHQFSSAVRQVDGELGSGTDTRTGSVFTSGNSRGMYGSGHYDLSNLQGRNFGEGTSFGESESHSSMLSNAGYREHANYMNNEQYRSSHSNTRHNAGYHSSGLSSSATLLDTQQAGKLNNNFNHDYGQQTANNYEYNSGRSSHYDENMENARLSGSNSRSRLISGIPVKGYVRPGTKIIIPVAAETYDDSHFDAIHDQNSIISDAETISNDNRQTHYKPITKHYESSYKYQKEWEKHDTKPIVVPTENPFTHNSEVYDNQITQDSSRLNSNSAYLNNYNADSKSASTQSSSYQSGYAAESQNSESKSAGSHSSQYIHGSHNLGTSSIRDSLVEDSRPKSYHSAYSYHKSWERQGDPYIIKPVGPSENVASPERLTAASDNYGHASSHQYGSQYSKSQHSHSKGCSVDCSEGGHIRVARSYNSQYQHPYQQSEDNFEQQNENADLEQQNQNAWDGLENLGQQTQDTWDGLNNFGQETQNKWENLDQQEQTKFDVAEISVQKDENTWKTLQESGKEQQYEHMPEAWSKLINLDQKTQTHSLEKIEDKGEQSQNTWNKLENLGQQTHTTEELEHMGQQTQTTWNKLENFGQQTQNSWDKLDSLGQSAQNQRDGIHLTHDSNQLTSSQTFHKWDHSPQETQNSWGNLYGFNQATESQWKNVQEQLQKDLEHLSQIEHSKINKYDHEHINGNYNNAHHNEQAYQNTHFIWSPAKEQNSQTNFHKYFVDSYMHKNYNHGYESTNYWNTDNDENYNYGTHLQQPSIYNIQEPHTHNINNKETPIISLWGKIDKIAHSSETQNSNEHDENMDNINSKIDKQEIPTSTVSTSTDNTNTYNNKSDNKVLQIDSNIPMEKIGRGDIDADDTSVETNHENIDIPSITSKYKTQDEIESLSLIKKETDEKQTHHEIKDSKELCVLGLQQNTQTGNTSPDNSNPKMAQDKTITSTTETLNTYNLKEDKEHFTSHNKFHANKEVHNSPMSTPKLITPVEIFEQQNMDQQFEDLGQISQELQTQTLEDFEQHQQNIKDKLQNFDQQNVDQQFQNIEQVNQEILPQTLEDFGQYQQRLENMQQNKLEDFEQHNTDQQLENVGQSYQEFQSQTIDDFKQHQQRSENIPDKQLQTFGPSNTQELNLHKKHYNHNDYQQRNSEPITQQHHNEILHEQSLPNQQKNENLGVASKSEENIKVEILEEPVTEKQGFWRSVGNKFTGVKDKISNWF